MSRTRANESVSVNNKRWAAYAAAGVAATLAGTQSAEADITWVVVGPGAGDLTTSAGTYTATLGPSATLAAAGGGGAALFGIIGGSVAGFLAGGLPYPYASNVSFGANISALSFLGLNVSATLAFGSGGAGGNDQFLDQGGYVAFRFNGATQFGWARLSLLDGAPENAYVLEEFAYGMVGDAVTVGETGAVPEPTSLGLLALGAVGVMANRRRKKIL
jgi:hypothetical protein